MKHRLAIIAVLFASTVSAQVVINPTGGGGSSRTALSADTTFYVRTDGSDSNTCLGNTAGAACLTLQGAYDKVVNDYDLLGWSASISVQAGTYAGGLNIAAGGYSSTVPGPLTITVAGVGPTTIVTSAIECRAKDCQVESMTLATFNGNAGSTASVDSIVDADYVAQDGARVEVTNAEFTGAPTVTNAFYSYGPGSYLYVGDTLVSGAQAFSTMYRAEFGGTVEVAGTLTLDANASFSNAFAVGLQSGVVDLSAAYYAGAGTASGAGASFQVGGRLVITDNQSLPSFSSGGALSVMNADFFSNGAPSISSCGTTPSMESNAGDWVGTFITGTGGAVTSCTLTFQLEYDTAPFCMVQNVTTAQVMLGVATGTTLTITGADFNGDQIVWSCKQLY